MWSQKHLLSAVEHHLRSVQQTNLASPTTEESFVTFDPRTCLFRRCPSHLRDLSRFDHVIECAPEANGYVTRTNQEFPMFHPRFFMITIAPSSTSGCDNHFIFLGCPPIMFRYVNLHFSSEFEAKGYVYQDFYFTRHGLRILLGTKATNTFINGDHFFCLMIARKHVTCISCITWLRTAFLTPARFRPIQCFNR